MRARTLEAEGGPTDRSVDSYLALAEQLTYVAQEAGLLDSNVADHNNQDIIQSWILDGNQGFERVAANGLNGSRVLGKSDEGRADVSSTLTPLTTHLWQNPGGGSGGSHGNGFAT